MRMREMCIRDSDKLIRSDSQLSMADRLGVLKEVCDALGYAHRNNVIHRDVKPANIFVQPDGTAKLLDFGIARLEKREGDQGLTRTGNLIGTVPYMAPERLRNENIDGRSDIFAAGVVLFQLVAGQLPDVYKRQHLYRAEDRQGQGGQGAQPGAGPGLGYAT